MSGVVHSSDLCGGVCVLLVLGLGVSKHFSVRSFVLNARVPGKLLDECFSLNVVFSEPFWICSFQSVSKHLAVFNRILEAQFLNISNISVLRIFQPS